MRKFIDEFKEFALQGNVFDMAIGVVIGGAFTAIVNSLVTDIITPLISVITNTENLEKLKKVLRPAVVDADGEVIKEALVLRYGNFIDSIISFLIVAIIIFLAIKAINKLMSARKVEEEEEEEEEVEEPSEEVVLLTQILEELKKD